ncbi:hypothetical protein Fuma_06246 [Fuerstiella marisgermanici]|uniref:SF3 helicase domain-containing protein n=2 Tax=Fuerstiella marisgermanici TaxID=1891926 RepID=A0A1P8WR89_9PLAN|nr:hypothetical protein Fuma_06246 [Fuerstiella marisgermanici]
MNPTATKCCFSLDAINKHAEGHWRKIHTSLTPLTETQLNGGDHPCPVCGGDDRFNVARDGEYERTGKVFCKDCGLHGQPGIGVVKVFGSQPCSTFPEACFQVGTWLIEHGFATESDLMPRTKSVLLGSATPKHYGETHEPHPTVSKQSDSETDVGQQLPKPLKSDKYPVFATAREALASYCELRPGDRTHKYHSTPDCCPFVFSSRVHASGEAKRLGAESVIRPVHKTADGWQGGLQMRLGRPLYAKFPRLLSSHRRSIGQPEPPRSFTFTMEVSFQTVPDLADATQVFICEDERDCEAILTLGLNATTTAGGQYAICMTDLRELSGKDLIIIPKHHEHRNAYAKKFRGELIRQLPDTPVQIKCLVDDGDFKSSRGDGPDAWLKHYLQQLGLHDDDGNLDTEMLTALYEQLLKVIDDLPDRAGEQAFEPEEMGSVTVPAADPTKTLHPGPVAAMRAVAFGLKRSGITTTQREPDRHDLYFSGPEQQEAELIFVSIRWDLTAEEIASSKNGKTKEIRQVCKVEGGWQCRNMYDAGRPLFKLFQPINGTSVFDSTTAFVCEGEPACEALRSIEVLATSLSQGAASPRKTDLSPLNGKTVTWLPDHDEAGEKFVRACRDQMNEQARDATVIVKCLSDDPDFGAVIKPGDDAVDLLEFHKDKTPAQLRNIIESLPDRSGEPRFWSTEDKLARIPLPSAKKLTATRQDELNELLCTCDLASGDAKVQAELAVCAFAIKHGVSKEETEEHWSSHGGGTSTDHFHTIWAQAAKAFRQNALEKLEGKSSSKRQESSTRISTPADEQGPTKNNASEKDDASSMDYATTGIAFLTINYRRKIAAKEHYTLVHWNGSFHEWSGAWRQIEDAKIESEVWHYIDETYERFSDSDVRNVVAAIRRKCYQSNEISYNTWSSGVDRGFRIAVDDGSLLDPARGTIEAPSHDWFSRTILPIAYDKNAKCELWEKVLLQNLEGDMDRYKLLQEFAGYCLWSELTFQKFLILLGEGANGKSVFLAGLSALLGLDNISNCNLESLTSNRFATVTTLGCLANLSAEISNVDRASEGVLKQLSSGDIMPFEQKHKPIVYAKPTAKLIFSCNDMPRFTDKSFGLYRRMIVVPFNREVPEHERIHDLDKPHRWKDELPGMLNWAIEGLQRLLEQKQFTYSEVCQAALTDYKFESNPAAAFLEERVTPDGRPNVRILKQELYNAYSNWCGHHGRRRLGDGEFAKEVRRKFKVSDARPSIDGLRQRVWRGIRMLSLKEQRERLDDEEAESQLDQLQRDLD